MNYQFVRQLLEHAEKFEQVEKEPEKQTTAAFAAWLLNQSAKPESESSDASPFGPVSPDTTISIMVSFLYRYARLYSKKVLDDSMLTTLDDFTYLVALFKNTDAPTKTDLIEYNIHEKTTGTEVIRRLLNNGLIEQFDDPNDRRAKRLKLTDRGREVMSALMPRMTKVATLVGGNLTQPEKQQLVYLLAKLHHFHNPLFLNDRHEPLDQLLKRIETNY